MMNPVDVGNTVEISVRIFSLAGILADPSAVVLEVKDPSGVASTVPATRTDTGKYSADVYLNLEGTWFFRWLATGAISAATEGQIFVKRSQFA